MNGRELMARLNPKFENLSSALASMSSLVNTLASGHARLSLASTAAKSQMEALRESIAQLEVRIAEIESRSARDAT